MKSLILSLFLVFSVSRAAIADDINLTECFRNNANLQALDFDPEFAWMQQKQRDFNNFAISPTNQKALTDLNEFFNGHGIDFTIALLPSPLFGHPTNSQLLAKRLRETAIQEHYLPAINMLRGLGIRAPDLVAIYDDFAPEEIQRAWQNHLTSLGAWATGAVIAETQGNTPLEAIDPTSNFARISELSQRSVSYAPMKPVRDALTDDCLAKIGRLTELDYFDGEPVVDSSTLFGDIKHAPPEITLVGTSYSAILDGAIGRAIAYFTQKEVANRAVRSGGPLTSFEYAFRAFTNETLASNSFVWELPDLGALSGGWPLGALMIAKGAMQQECTPESLLFSEGKIEIDENGNGVLPVLGVLEDRIEIDVPNESISTLGRVDKRDSHRGAGMIQAGICYGDQLGTRPDVGRGMGVL